MATENSGGPNLPPSWPETSPRETPASWPESSTASVPTSWPEAPQSSWPEPPRPDPSWPEPPRAGRASGAQSGGWPEVPRSDSPRQDAGRPASPRQDAAWPENSSHVGGSQSWPENPTQAGGSQSWPETPRQDAPRQEPVPSWAQPPTPEPGAWSNLSSPAPWPQAAEPSAAAWSPQTAEPSPAWSPQTSESSPAWSPQTPESSPAWSPQGAEPSPAWSPQTAEQAPGSWPQAAEPPQGASGNPADRTVTLGRPAARPDPLNDPLNGPLGGPSGDRRPDPLNDPLNGPMNGPLNGPMTGGPGMPGTPSMPADERTVTFGQHSAAQSAATPLDQQGMPPGPPNPATPLNDHAVPSSPLGPGEDRPGAKLSRDPSDPDHRFVTAGQISGSRTPPPDRQQELWNNVFGDEYSSMGDDDSLDEPGKPIWIYALGGSVAIALVAALLWAFLAGPLAGAEPEKSAAPTKAATPAKTPPPKQSNTIPALPRYSGQAAPVVGTVTDSGAGISVPQLGGTWKLDQRATVKGTYNFNTRQYVQTAPDTYANLLTGPLPQSMAAHYDQANLEPAIRQVVLAARKRFFPQPNKVKKIAQQNVKVGDASGRLIAYELTSDTQNATIVTIALNTGADLPAIVYMSIPEDNKELLPDIRTVLRQMKITV
ncbi:hypothetical protein HII36_40850 [Nonomuraea sp. NN258]|uniref:hypothetical protein n=1 Tax=Nonomuraea antri TaxID=2730852 RepID=UPI001567F760|nr:hypothetical protein [Nonomuraea antri]NRQ38136.1 hypothetical protein [Nonomuraea antri]